MDKRPNKIGCVQLIIEQIKDGNTYSESLDYFEQKWRVPQSTFANYWKEAQQTYLEQQQAIQNKVATLTAEKEISDGRTHLYDKAEKAEGLLNDIKIMREEIAELRKVKITGTKIGTKVIATTQQDVTNAKRTIAQLQASINSSLELLSKWYGYQDGDVNQQTNITNVINLGNGTPL